MATTTISARVESDEAALIEALALRAGCDKSTYIKMLLRQGIKTARLESAFAAYSAEEVTLSKAAELAGISIWDFVAAMPEKRLEVHYDVAEFEEDLQALSQFPAIK